MQKMTEDELQNSTIKRTFKPQEGLETSEQSTGNVALCEISMG